MSLLAYMWGLCFQVATNAASKAHNVVAVGWCILKMFYNNLLAPYWIQTAEGWQLSQFQNLYDLYDNDNFILLSVQSTLQTDIKVNCHFEKKWSTVCQPDAVLS